VFDLDLVMHINSVFSTLQQLGVGPIDGFSIEDNTSTWDEFIVLDKRLNSVKSYMVMKVRQYFDPPATSFALAALEKLVTEAEWRLMVAAESDKLALPGTVIIVEEPEEPFVPLFYTGG
jgi:hypothetical protein